MKGAYSQASVNAQHRAEQAMKCAQALVAYSQQALEAHRAFRRIFLQQYAIDRTHHIFQEKYAQLQRALAMEKVQPTTRVHLLKVALLQERAQCSALERDKSIASQGDV